MEQQVSFIVIHCNRPDADTMKELLAGIEEEGLTFYVNQSTIDKDCVTLSYGASKMSSVGVGIGIAGKNVKLSVQNQMKPFLMDTGNTRARIIGQNAARYIKHKPLI
mgnify:CR=1 FL=1